MKKTTLLMALFFAFTMAATAQKKDKKKADSDTKAWRYEIEVVQTGTQGTYLVKVFSYSKKPDIAIEQAKKNAVHGIIFKGFAGKATVPGKSALVTDSNVEEKEEAFFTAFFNEGGNYLKFVSYSTDAAVDAADRMKIGKEYKVGVIVSVQVAELRKYLEEEKIIKSLSHGF